MECLFGFVGEDFCILATDATAARSVVVMKATEDRTRVLSKNLALCYSGESGDAVRFAEYCQRNIQLYEIKHGIRLNPESSANFIRSELARSLRSRVCT